MSPAQTIPADFQPVTLGLSGEQEALGYRGACRYVGFYWERVADVLAWFDGRSLEVGHGDAKAFMRRVMPLSFLYGVNLGEKGEATHFFVLDRFENGAYLAPWESALEFLCRQGEFVPDYNAGLLDSSFHPLV